MRTVRPGETPLAALVDTLEGEVSDPAQGVSELLATQPDAERLLLVVDQLEELFTLAHSDVEPFQQMLLRPTEYSVVATMNLNGDYVTDAAAAQVGGLGVAPGANINYDTGHAIFEATHGTAPKHAGQDKVNPGSIILSAVEMLRYLGWPEAAEMVLGGIKAAIASKHVTYDLERQMEGATLVSCSQFGDEIIKNM